MGPGGQQATTGVLEEGWEAQTSKYAHGLPFPRLWQALDASPACGMHKPLPSAGSSSRDRTILRSMSSVSGTPSITLSPRQMTPSQSKMKQSTLSRIACLASRVARWAAAAGSASGAGSYGRTWRRRYRNKSTTCGSLRAPCPRCSNAWTRQMIQMSCAGASRFDAPLASAVALILRCRRLTEAFWAGTALKVAN